MLEKTRHWSLSSDFWEEQSFDAISVSAQRDTCWPSAFEQIRQLKHPRKPERMSVISYHESIPFLAPVTLPSKSEQTERSIDAKPLLQDYAESHPWPVLLLVNPSPQSIPFLSHP